MKLDFSLYFYTQTTKSLLIKACIHAGINTHPFDQIQFIWTFNGCFPDIIIHEKTVQTTVELLYTQKKKNIEFLETSGCLL